ncbi:ribosomal protein L10 [Oesophagostomum dentatum]|uniref:Large ribosomal subunit protein uL10 n=1 Tax=Oesophagostomum dentatum TaxID=61180 RepID=A0A0B1TMU1_OESDE|nr:ribosomal protein L10 [Oesophagostomum dentatum]
MVREDRTTWKANYFLKLVELFDEYPKCFLVGVDNVGSKQMQEIRQAMRGHAVILMGKNTMIRKAIRGHLSKNPSLEKLLPYIVQNVGFVFTKEDLGEIRTKLLENRRGAPAKAGAIAPCDVKLPPQNTGMGPEKTSFFQALQIPTKIARGTIEILNEVHLIKEGEKVGASEAALLNMLGITPFSYGLIVLQVYDNGTIYTPDVLDMTTEELRNRFMAGVRNVAAVSLAIKYPTMVSVAHSLARGLQNMLGIAAATDVTFKEAEQLKEYLADPSKFAAAAPVATSAAPAAAPAETKKEEMVLMLIYLINLAWATPAVMLIFKDVFTDDELASDSFPMKLVDDLVYEFKGRHVIRKEGEIMLPGANPSAEGEEGGDEGTEEHVERGIDIVLNHKLVEMNCYEDPATFKSYIKSFMKKVVEYMEKNGKTKEEVDTFKKKIQTWVVSLLDKKRWKTLQFFIGERMADGAGDGQVAIIEYRDIDGEEVPTLMLIKEAITSEKI